MAQYKFIETASEELMNLHAQARNLTREYALLDYRDNVKKREIIEKLFGSVGNNVHVDMKIHCDFGKNIFIGNDVIIGANCTFIDNAKIKIGNTVMIAPNLQIYTAYHPILPEDRYIYDREPNDPLYFNTCADPVEIKDGAWIGGGVIILPGVTIGKNSIIGAGSVVSRSIPDNCVAVGNPCKPIKFFDDIRKMDRHWENFI